MMRDTRTQHRPHRGRSTTTAEFPPLTRIRRSNVASGREPALAGDRTDRPSDPSLRVRRGFGRRTAHSAGQHTLWMPIIRSWALTRGFALHPGTRNRYEIRYTRTQHRPPSGHFDSSERPAARASSTNTNMLPDQPRHHFGHPHGGLCRWSFRGASRKAHGSVVRLCGRDCRGYHLRLRPGSRLLRAAPGRSAKLMPSLRSGDSRSGARLPTRTLRTLPLVRRLVLRPQQDSISSQ